MVPKGHGYKGPTDPYADEVRGMTSEEEARYRQYRRDVVGLTDRHQTQEVRDEKKARIAEYEAEKRSREAMDTDVDKDERDGGPLGAAFDHIQRVGDVLSNVEEIKFDPDGIDKVIARVDALLERVEVARREAVKLARIQLRGDYVSDSFAGVANGAGENYLNYLTKTGDELAVYAESLERIKKNYVARESDIAAGYRGIETG